MAVEPEKFEFETTTETRARDGSIRKETTKTSWDAVDMVAAFAGLVAVLVVIGFMTNLIPINKMTISLASLSGLAAVVMGATRGTRKKRVAKNAHGATPGE